MDWNRVVRLQWPNLLQSFAKVNPLHALPGVLYIMPPSFPYPVFFTLNNQGRFLIINSSFLDYARSEKVTEFAFRAFRPMSFLQHHVPPHLYPLSAENTQLTMFLGSNVGFSPNLVVADFIRMFALDKFLRVSKHTPTCFHMHLTPNRTRTNQDADLVNMLMMTPEEPAFELFFTPAVTSLILAAYNRFHETFKMPESIEITLDTNIAMLKEEGLPMGKL